MGYYINIENGELNGTSEVNNSRFYTETYFQAEVSQEIYEDYSENPDKYLYDAEFGAIVENPDYEGILAERERERVAKLKMTPRDFLLAITSMGIKWADIKALMAQNPQVEIELNYCQYVYRGNPLLDDLCGNFFGGGYT